VAIFWISFWSCVYYPYSDNKRTLTHEFFHFALADHSLVCVHKMMSPQHTGWNSWQQILHAVWCMFAYLFAGVIVATVQICRHLENANVAKSTHIVDRKIEEVGLTCITQHVVCQYTFYLYRDGVGKVEN
jgi:hypothetical protein